MIVGEFDEHGRPYIVGRLVIGMIPTNATLECAVRYADYSLAVS